MKALILSCNTGEGHNSVSYAIQEAFFAHGQTCEIVDVLSFLSKRASKFICDWHVRIYRHIPSAFSRGYRFAESHPGVYEEKSLVNKFLASGSKKMHAFLTENLYDCVICPHVFSGLMVTEMLRRCPMKELETCFVATDYTCSPMTDESSLDWYFIPDEQVASEFCAVGIPQNKLVITDGIPVRCGFLSRTPKEEAKERLGIRPTSKHLFMMGGSMGCGPIGELVDLLAERMPPDTVLTVICGTNHRLLKKLEKEYGGSASIRALGFVDNIPLLMDSADLFLTKPGGISTSEAAAKGLPMVLIDAVSGCEKYNLHYFCELGGAVTADSTEEIASLCAAILSDRTRLAKMSDSFKKEGNAADDIYRHLNQS